MADPRITAGHESAHPEPMTAEDVRAALAKRGNDGYYVNDPLSAPQYSVSWTDRLGGRHHGEGKTWEAALTMADTTTVYTPTKKQIDAAAEEIGA